MVLEDLVQGLVQGLAGLVVPLVPADHREARGLRREATATGLTFCRHHVDPDPEFAERHLSYTITVKFCISVNDEMNPRRGAVAYGGSGPPNRDTCLKIQTPVAASDVLSANGNPATHVYMIPHPVIDKTSNSRSRPIVDAVGGQGTIGVPDSIQG